MDDPSAKRRLVAVTHPSPSLGVLPQDCVFVIIQFCPVPLLLRLRLVSNFFCVLVSQRRCSGSPHLTLLQGTLTVARALTESDFELHSQFSHPAKRLLFEPENRQLIRQMVKLVKRKWLDPEHPYTDAQQEQLLAFLKTAVRYVSNTRQDGGMDDIGYSSNGGAKTEAVIQVGSSVTLRYLFESSYTKHSNCSAEDYFVVFLNKQKPGEGKKKKSRKAPGGRFHIRPRRQRKKGQHTIYRRTPGTYDGPDNEDVASVDLMDRLLREVFGGLDFVDRAAALLILLFFIEEVRPEEAFYGGNELTTTRERGTLPLLQRMRARLTE